MNRDFQIEKLVVDYDSSVRYRITFSVWGEQFREEISISRDDLDRESKREAVLCGVRALMLNIEGRIVVTLDNLYQREGEYDTTRIWREMEQREYLEHARQQSMYHQQMYNSQYAQQQQAMSENYLQQMYGMGNNLGALANVFAPGSMYETYNKPKQSDKDKKAMKLLSSKIGWRKMRHLKKKGYFEEEGKHGKVRFHLNTSGGVSLIEKKKFGNTERELEWSLCVQSVASDLPKGDVILSRWLEWKADEDKFLDTANFRSVKTRDEAIQGRI